MARPQKKGLDYFPLDTDMDVVNDDVMMLEAKYGTIGFTTLIKLYMKIYQDNGYFMEWNEKASLLLSKRINVNNNSVNDSINLINDIINDLVRWNVFDEKLYKKYKILTSNRIQKTYMEAVKKRKDVEMDKRYLTKGQIVNDNINLINSDINTTKKSKEENRIEENSKEIDFATFDKMESTHIFNKKEIEILKLYEEDSINKLFNDYLVLRISIKATNTKRAVKALYNKLTKLTKEQKEEVLNDAIVGSWKSIYTDKYNLEEDKYANDRFGRDLFG